MRLTSLPGIDELYGSAALGFTGGVRAGHSAANEGFHVITLTGQMAEQAESIVNTLTQTDYQHSDNIVPTAGIYERDCNGFVGYVLSIVAPRHAALIAPETT
jgi:hypothetical protein